MLLNQGWAFFTKNPRDVRTQVFKNGVDIITPLTSVESGFGLQSIQGIHMRLDS